MDCGGVKLRNLSWRPYGQWHKLNFEIGEESGAELLGFIVGSSSSRGFGKVAKGGECLEFVRCKKYWLLGCTEPTAEPLEEVKVVGQTWMKVGTVFLPTVGFEVQVVGYARPVKCGLPLGDEEVFVNPALVVVCGCLVSTLLELCATVVLTLWDAGSKWPVWWYAWWVGCWSKMELEIDGVGCQD